MSGTWTRRDFIVRAGLTGGLLAAGGAVCSDDDDASGGAGGGGDDVGDDGGTTGSDGLDGDAFPSEATIHGWIAEVVDQGIRRPGYEADDWAIDWVADRFRDIGLDDVHTEPVDVLRWEPVEWSLEVTAADGTTESLDCFPVPYAAPTPAAGLDLELAAYDSADPAAVAGKASLYDVTLLRLPGNFMATAGSIPEGATAESRSVDPDGTLADPQVIPFGGEIMQVLEPSIEAGAAAFIGVLSRLPGRLVRVLRALRRRGAAAARGVGPRQRRRPAARPAGRRPGAGAAGGTTDVRTVESANVVGDLPGADDEVVMIASHHDGPWASAVEDGSGIALVLAQATYWAAQPAEARPHRLRFLLQGGHMSGGAGLMQYIVDHGSELSSVVRASRTTSLEVGVASGEPPPRRGEARGRQLVGRRAARGRRTRAPRARGAARARPTPARPRGR